MACSSSMVTVPLIVAVPASSSTAIVASELARIVRAWSCVMQLFRFKPSSEHELEAHAPREIRDHHCLLSTAGTEHLVCLDIAVEGFAGAFDDQSNWGFSSAIALASWHAAMEVSACPMLIPGIRIRRWPDQALQHPSPQCPPNGCPALCHPGRRRRSGPKPCAELETTIPSRPSRVLVVIAKTDKSADT